MTLDVLLTLLRFHLAALESNEWPTPHGPHSGPALYLDAADTSALITELTAIQRKLETGGSGSEAALPSQAGTARSTAATATKLEERTTTGAPAVSDTRMDELILKFGRSGAACA